MKKYYHGHRGGIWNQIIMNQTEGENKTVVWLVLVLTSMPENGRLTLVQHNIPIFVKGVSDKKFPCLTPKYECDDNDLFALCFFD